MYDNECDDDMQGNAFSQLSMVTSLPPKTLSNNVFVNNMSPRYDIQTNACPPTRPSQAVTSDEDPDGEAPRRLCEAGSETGPASPSG